MKYNKAIVLYLALSLITLMFTYGCTEENDQPVGEHSSQTASEGSPMISSDVVTGISSEEETSSSPVSSEEPVSSIQSEMQTSSEVSSEFDYSSLPWYEQMIDLTIYVDKESRKYEYDSIIIPAEVNNSFLIYGGMYDLLEMYLYDDSFFEAFSSNEDVADIAGGARKIYGVCQRLSEDSPITLNSLMYYNKPVGGEWARDISKAELNNLLETVKMETSVFDEEYRGAKIANIFCMRDLSENKANLIYYVTDIGDFVIYIPEGETAEFFTIEDFREFASDKIAG